MKILNRIIVLLAIVCTVSCGQRRQAQGVIEDFLKENLKSQEYAIHVIDFDSTRHLKHDVVNRLREEAKKDKSFKSDIKYAEIGNNSYMTRYARVEIIQGGTDTLVHTFYLDHQVKGVICLKSN